MHTFRLVRMMVVFVLVGTWGEWVTAQEQAPKPLPQEIVAAWEKAGAQTGWMGRRFFYFRRGEEGRAGEVPAFYFRSWKPGVLRELPAPPQPFGLSLSSTQVADVGLKELASLKQLQRLDLSGMQVTDGGLKELASLQQLQVLYLGDTRVTDAGLKELANLKRLHWLNLGGTRATDAGLKELTGLKLKQLWIPDLAKTDLGLKHYLAAIETPMALDLSRWNITAAGLKELAGLKQLRELDLGGTQVTNAGVAELQKRLPGCFIFR